LWVIILFKDHRVVDALLPWPTDQLSSFLSSISVTEKILLLSLLLRLMQQGITIHSDPLPSPLGSDTDDDQFVVNSKVKGVSRRDEMKWSISM
jgi:hypothetical protein